MFFDNPIENLLTWGALLYFLPSLCALRTGRFAAVFVLNLFLGWTLVGWVIALAWALSPSSSPPPAIMKSLPQFGRPVAVSSRVLTTVHPAPDAAHQPLRIGMPVVLRRAGNGELAVHTEAGLYGYLDNNTARVVDFRSETIGKPTAKIVLVDDLGIDLEIAFQTASA